MEFPVISQIDDILPAIKNKPEFVVMQKEGYQVVNYNVNFIDTFENPFEEGISLEEAELRMLRKECRGIIFDEYGNLISRPFHKFHNWNENAESTIVSEIFSKEDHVVLEKLDGSMVRPFIVDKDVIWGSKAGETFITEQVKQFFDESGTEKQYDALARELIKEDITPLFEWCSPENRIVVDYKDSDLVLTAMRNMVTGEYYNYATLTNIGQKFGVPIVQLNTDFDHLGKLAEHAKSLIGEEGYVVRFANGYMIKLKAEEYCLLHRTKEALQFEKNVLRVILEGKLDDFIPLVMTDEDREKLETYSASVHNNVENVAKLISDVLRSNMHLVKDQKDLAINVIQKLIPKELHSIAFKKAKDMGIDTQSLVIDWMKSYTNTGIKVDKLRNYDIIDLIEY